MSDYRNISVFSGATPMVVLGSLFKWVGQAKGFCRLFSKVGGSPMVLKSFFKGYTPNEKDTFAASYMKSGTNWSMQTMLQIAWKGEATFDHIHDLVPWPETPVPSLIASQKQKGRQMESPTGLRVIKTHTVADYVPYSESAKYVTLIRDPKEVFVSSYLFMPPILGLSEHLTMEDWLELFLGGRFPGLSWAEHTDSYWKWRDRPNVEVFNFADMKTKQEECTRKIMKLMEVELTEAEFAKVMELASFKHMKANERQFCPPGLPLTDRTKRPKMVRSGKIGNSAELISREQQAAIDAYWMGELEKLGSDFPYREWFDVVE